jgi:hypothetical protein
MRIVVIPMRVAFGGAQSGMAEPFPNDLQVRSPGQHPRGMRMPRIPHPNPPVHPRRQQAMPRLEHPSGVIIRPCHDAIPAERWMPSPGGDPAATDAYLAAGSEDVTRDP